MTRTDGLEGKTLGKYQLTQQIGAGAMGAVYQGFDPEVQREVAVKVIATDVSDDPLYIARFNREIKVTSALKHPNIVAFYDSGTQDGINYAVMRLLTGGALDQRLHYLIRKGLPLPKVEGVVRISQQLASALDYAHTLGIIHRDIKPSNIMFDQQENAYLVDFGIVKIAEATTELTNVDTQVGTPAYMAPEVWRGEDVHPATDQYALATSVFFMLTGKIPFDATNITQAMLKHTQEMPPAPHTLRHDLNPALEVVFLKSLAKYPEDRYPTNGDFAAALEAAALRGETAVPGMNDNSVSGMFINLSGLPDTEKLLSTQIVSSPLNDTEKVRNALRVLFAQDYADDSTPIKRQVAYKLVSRTDDTTLTDLLLNDLIRGGFAELVLRYALGDDVFNALLIQLRTGDVPRAKDILANTPVDGAALGALLGADLRTIVSNLRVDINTRGQGVSEATADLVQGAGEQRADDIVAAVFGSEGETRRDGVAYLRELGAEGVVAAVTAVLEGGTRPNEDVLDAIEVLAAYHTDEAEQALRRLSRGHGMAAVRGMAVLALAHMLGDFRAVVEGVVREWGEYNPRLAEQTLMYFGDETDYDKLLLAMLRDENERKRIIAAGALGMSGNADYALPLARFLFPKDKDRARERRRALVGYENDNPQPIITVTIADKLRALAQTTTLQAPTPAELDEMEPLLRALVRLGNAEAEAALRGVVGNPRVDERVRTAAERALARLRERRQ